MSKKKNNEKEKLMPPTKSKTGVMEVHNLRRVEDNDEVFEIIKYLVHFHKPS